LKENTIFYPNFYILKIPKNNKKEVKMFEGPKSVASALIGIILLVLGTVPLANMMGIISFGIPEIPNIILLIILSVSGCYLIIDGIMEFALNLAMGLISILVGLFSGAAGILQLLNMYGSVLGWIQGPVIHVLFVIIGILLFLGAFMF
jgi:hypothetical protein